MVVCSRVCSVGICGTAVTVFTVLVSLLNCLSRGGYGCIYCIVLVTDGIESRIVCVSGEPYSGGT